MKLISKTSVQSIIIATFMLFFLSDRCLNAAINEDFRLMSETLEVEVAEGQLDLQSLGPLVIVHVDPGSSEFSQEYLIARVVSAVKPILRGSAIEICRPCLKPMWKEEKQSSVFRSGAPSIDTVRQQMAIEKLKARSAVWITTERKGISWQIVDLQNGRVLSANSVLRGTVASQSYGHSVKLAKNRQRFWNRDPVLHGWFDAAMYPGTHFSYNWMEQWGKSGRNLTGISFSFLNPNLSLGLAYEKILIDAQQIAVGGRLYANIPLLLAGSFDDSNPGGNVFDLMVTVRAPIPGWLGYRFRVFVMATTAGAIGTGVSF